MIFDITLIFLSLLFGKMSTLPSDDLLDKLVEDVVDVALAPLLARQNEIEIKTIARLENIQSTITIDDLPDKLIENAINDALTPLLNRQKEK